MKKIVVTTLAVIGIAAGILGLEPFWESFNAQAQTAQVQQVTPIDETQAYLQDETNTISVVDTFGPSVVAVNVEVRGQRVDPFSQGNLPDFIPPEFRRFFQLPEPPSTPAPQDEGSQEFQQQGAGSGFVISEDGDIVTNYHVVRSTLEEDSVTPLENTRISVVFPSSDVELTASVVGVNALYDLALLRLDNPDDLPAAVQPIPIADSSELRVGQKTIAIGNPFGFASTVTTGIISGIGRSLPGVGEANIPLVQTDAAINPGNSGGPLLNSQGELIGVNTAIIPGQGAGFGERTNIGIGFAVPSNLLERNLAELQAGGYADILSRPRLGVSITSIRAYPESVRESLNLPNSGVVIQTVERGGAAERAGLQGGRFPVEINGQATSLRSGGDVILAVDGETVSTPGDIQDIVLAKQDGDEVELRIWRDGEEQTLDVTLSVVPATDEPVTAAEPDATPEETQSGARLGVSIQDVSSYPDAVRETLNLPEQGAVITAVAPDSAAAAAGLRGGQFALEDGGQQYAAGGDVILGLDGQVIDGAATLQNLIAERSPGDEVDLRVWRNGEEQTLTATLGSAEASE